jgi:hypothetical protein
MEQGVGAIFPLAHNLDSDGGLENNDDVNAMQVTTFSLEYGM